MTGPRIASSRVPSVIVDGVLREDAERLAVPVVPDLLGQVLDEVTAAQDVQELEAATDRERRKVALERRLEQLQLAGVAVRLGRIGGGVPLGAVPRGIDVDPAREDEAVEHVERLVHRVSLGGTSRARPPACSTDST